MTDYTKLSYLVKREILNFSEKICRGLKKPEYKLISNMLYGVSESGSCHLSKIGRALKESISLKKTIERLSRGLNDFSDRDQKKLLDNHAQTVRKYIDERTVYVIDGSDVTKPSSFALECLDLVHDGSTGKIEKGYFTLEIAALTQSSKTPIPVYDRVYSAKEESFISADEEVLNGLRYLSEKLGKQGIRTMDRGYDALVYYEYFLKNQEKFIIRATKNRNVCYKDETRNILEVAKLYKGKYRIDFKDKKGRTVECKTSIIPVALPKYPKHALNMVVVYGFGNDPMMLLTNLKIDDSGLANAVAKVYLMRWRIEEYFRFKKQQYDFEGFRVRSLNSIRTLHRILTLLAGFVGTLSEKREDNCFVLQLIEASKRIFRPKKEKAKRKFMNYAIADGILEALRRSAVGILGFLSPPRCASPQLSLFIP
jgi:hypothetical protein